MALGKTICLYLADGAATGPIIAEIINWTGQVTVVPRAQLAKLARREKLQRTGVYFLVGPDPETAQDRIYIGEGDDVFARLKAHDKDETKLFWTRAVAVTSKDFNLTKAHGRYLESRLVEKAAIARRAVITNGTTPLPKVLPEPDVADMEYFLDQIDLVLPVLGVDVLRPLATRELRTTINAPVMHLREVGVVARAIEVDGVFVVLKGSTARRQHAPSWEANVIWRDQLVAEGKLVPLDDAYFQFADDVEFNSPSAAAAVVVASSRNGRTSGSWKMASLMVPGRMPRSQQQSVHLILPD